MTITKEAPVTLRNVEERNYKEEFDAMIPSISAVVMRGANVELDEFSEGVVVGLAESMDMTALEQPNDGYNNRFMKQQHAEFLAQRALGDDCGWE